VTVIADTGALYALTDASDAWHTRVVDWWKQNRKPVLVPVSVLPEVTWLLETRISAEAEIAFIRAIADGEFVTEAIDPGDFDRAAALMERYADFPLGFVDATVVAIAERADAMEILTTDRRHFSAVRPAHTRSLTLVP
jgi:hypothetical protein